RTELLPIAKECNTNLAGLALSFVLGNRQVSTVIPGMRNAAQVRANTQQLVKLSASQMAYLQQLYHTRWQPVMSMLQILG
ncbi:MAG TPA: aldo/keto reductase, partial [Phnomibacter sp.]|nr:aldo/keto reductase [Phnomibacter sp.]